MKKKKKRVRSPELIERHDYGGVDEEGSMRQEAGRGEGSYGKRESENGVNGGGKDEVCHEEDEMAFVL